MYKNKNQRRRKFEDKTNHIKSVYDNPILEKFDTKEIGLNLMIHKDTLFLTYNKAHNYFQTKNF